MQPRGSRALFLLLWGVFVVSLLDDLLQPIVIGSKTEVSTFLLFFGILGGAQAYGSLGIFVGRVLLATPVVVLRARRQERTSSGTRSRDRRGRSSASEPTVALRDRLTLGRS